MGNASHNHVLITIYILCKKENNSGLGERLRYIWGFIRDVPLTPYFHLTDGNLTKDTYNVLRRL